MERVGVGDIKIKHADCAFIGAQFTFLFSSLGKDAGPSEVITQCFIYAVTL